MPGGAGGTRRGSTTGAGATVASCVDTGSVSGPDRCSEATSIDGRAAACART